MAPPSPPPPRRGAAPRAVTVAAVLVAAVVLAAAAPASASRSLAGARGQFAANGGARPFQQQVQQQRSSAPNGGGGGGGGQGVAGPRGGGGGWRPQQSQQTNHPQQQKLGSAQVPSAFCLVIFDVDRSLTGIQGSGEKPAGNGVCPLDKTTSIADTAWGGGYNGKLTISNMGRNVYATNAGKDCYLGIISHGDDTSDAERNELAHRLSRDAGNAKMPAANSLYGAWTNASKSTNPAPFIHSAPDLYNKWKYIPMIKKYYESIGGSSIPDEQIWLFDDERLNVLGFKNSGKKYNAVQISCESRDDSHGQHSIGKCGGTMNELHRTVGCHVCAQYGTSGLTRC